MAPFIFVLFSYGREAVIGGEAGERPITGGVSSSFFQGLSFLVAKIHVNSRATRNPDSRFCADWCKICDVIWPPRLKSLGVKKIFLFFSCMTTNLLLFV